jgi:hypothetical protein
MSVLLTQAQGRAFSTMRDLVRRQEARERCDLCGTGLVRDHQHLIEPVARRLVCACDACAVLFPQGADTKYKRVPRGGRLLAGFQLPDGQWDSLLIPIGMAFFLKSSVEGKVLAFYPSPAGATESMLSLDAWNGIVADNPVLNEIESDVEALLVNRLDHGRGAERSEYYLVPIDKCYELVGLIRSHWRGLSGGADVWRRIRCFFDDLKEMKNSEVSHA